MCTYDVQGRPKEIRNGRTTMRAVSYDSLGRENTVTDRLSGTDSITTGYSYDTAGRLKTSTAKNSSNTQIEKLTYTYGGTRITQRREQSSLPGITALDETRTYTYDGLGRLTNSTSGTDSTQYTYDVAGNQISEDTGDVYRERYYNDLDQLSWEGVYDHNGIRTEKIVDGAKTDYYYAEGKPIISTSTSHTETNIFDGEEISGAYHGSTWYDYLADQQGSNMGILKQNGTTAAAYSYSDFGETTSRYGASFDNEICYTGAVYDSDYGEYYLNARYYDPTTANFLSQDTYRGDTGDYGQWSLYAYCANDPVNRIDPSGHLSMDLPNWVPKWIKIAVKKIPAR